MNFFSSTECDVGFAGYVAAINISVEELVVESSCNLRFQPQWKHDELQAIGVIFQEDVAIRLQRNVGHL